MSNDTDEREYFFGKREDMTYITKSFLDRSNRAMRYVSKVIDGDAGVRSATVENEIVLRTTPKGRNEIKAITYEDSRDVQTLTIQK
nr:hypothetical protein [Paracoccaceae bacterium]